MKKLILVLGILIPSLLHAQNKVGIGTNAPVQRLSVDSTLNIDQGNYDDGSGKPSLRFGDGNTGEGISSKRNAGGLNPYGLDFYTNTAKRMVITNAGYVGIRVTNPFERLHVNGPLLITYSFASDTIQNSSINPGLQQLFFNPVKGALRFGSPGPASNWYNNNTGLGSFAFGSGTVANNFGSFAYGANTIASGSYATALGGYGNIAEGYGAVAGGNGSIARFSSSFAFGDNLIAKASNGAVFGSYNDTTNSGYFSVGNGDDNDSRHTAFVVKENGNVGVGLKFPQQPFAIDSFAVVDQGNHNIGTKPSLIFGGLSAEGIGSRRTTGGTNPYGLDFWTNSINRMVITNTGNVGIGTASPGFRFEVVDNTDFPLSVHSNSGQTLLSIGSDIASPANVGAVIYKAGILKAAIVVDASNNLILSASSTALPHIAITPSGNVGIGRNDATYPLNFTNTLGDKISLYGNGTTTYGFGVQNNLLQIHSDNINADIAFGYGSSTSFSEAMRIKSGTNMLLKGDLTVDNAGINNGFLAPGLRFGASNSGEGISSKRSAGGNQNGLDIYTNGNARMSIDNSGLIGINGNTTPGARLQVNQTGNYSNGESSTHALEIWDNNETLYMGADAGNTISYIQAVGNSTFHTLALQARGGNVAIGKNSATEKLDVNGNGSFSGNLTAQNGKGIVRNYNSTQLKTETLTFTFPGLVALGAGNTTNLSVTFPETYSAAPMVYVAGLVPSAGSAGYLECVFNISSITTSGFTLSIYNPRASGAVFNNGTPNFALNFVAVGAQ